VQLNQFTVTLQIKNPNNGTWGNFGIWDKQSGGGVTSSLRKYQPGGGQKEIVLGGKFKDKGMAPFQGLLTPAQVDDVEREAGALLRELGY
jgi:hypothetical protein